LQVLAPPSHARLQPPPAAAAGAPRWARPMRLLAPGRARPSMCSVYARGQMQRLTEYGGNPIVPRLFRLKRCAGNSPGPWPDERGRRGHVRVLSQLSTRFSAAAGACPRGGLAISAGASAAFLLALTPRGHQACLRFCARPTCRADQPSVRRIPAAARSPIPGPSALVVWCCATVGPWPNRPRRRGLVSALDCQPQGPASCCPPARVP